jgi:hypothetical protein
LPDYMAQQPRKQRITYAHQMIKLMPFLKCNSWSAWTNIRGTEDDVSTPPVPKTNHLATVNQFIHLSYSHFFSFRFFNYRILQTSSGSFQGPRLIPKPL